MGFYMKYIVKKITATEYLLHVSVHIPEARGPTRFANDQQNVRH